MSVPKLETIAITLFKNGVAEIAHNRPKFYNALSPQSTGTDEVKVAILTGKGKFYTSGQQLVMPATNEEELQRECDTTQAVVNEMIRFPKLLIGAVNGSSIGFGTTTLALCDVIYSVPEATFSTPFMKLAFCAEGCSSVLFPRIMGSSKANEMLLLGRTFTAQEMVDCGFISRLISPETFNESVIEIANQAAQFSVSALKTTKGLIRNVDIETLDKANIAEMSALKVRMKSKDSIQSIQNFLEAAKRRKAKL
ncbi:unnamed protein product [Rhizopus stolonifer]